MYVLGTNGYAGSKKAIALYDKLLMASKNNFSLENYLSWTQKVVIIDLLSQPINKTYF